jgi:hypothetical protein
MESGTSVTAIAIVTNREQCIRKLVVSFYCQSICKSAVIREAISTYWEFLKIASGFHVP